MARETKKNKATRLLLIVGAVFLAQTIFLFAGEPVKVTMLKFVRYTNVIIEENAGKIPYSLKVRDVRLRHSKMKYRKNYKSRTNVNFDTGLITVEPARNEPHLKNAVVTAILTPKDPRAEETFSDDATALQGRPYLDGLIRNQHGYIINSFEMATAYASYLVKHEKKTRNVRQQGHLKAVKYVQIKMVNNRRNKRALRYSHSVNHYSKRYDISKSLVYSIMQVESNFNPQAVSHASAYGLMQIVPHSGGRDAHQLIHQYDKIPDKRYLLEADNNIEMGVAYLHILYYKYLAEIKDPVSREYCTIAAYNTGTGNVFKAFSKNRAVAIRRINRLSSGEIYQHLRKFLPYEETRKYLYKVTMARPKYIGL